MRNSCSEKSKIGGTGLPFGSLQLGCRNSSKNVWAHAWNGDNRALGVYSKRRETRSTASEGVRGRNTCNFFTFLAYNYWIKQVIT